MFGGFWGVEGLRVLGLFGSCRVTRVLTLFWGVRVVSLSPYL